jgi:hypothetical protein
MQSNAQGVTETSPVSQASEARTDNTPSLAASRSLTDIAKDFVSNRADGKKDPKSQNKEDANLPSSDSDQSSLSAEDQPQNSESSEDKQEASSKGKPQDTRWKKRVDTLTARNKQTLQELQAAKKELEEYKAMAQITMSELQRIAPRANLDKTEEALQNYKLQEQIANFEREIAEKVEQEFAEKNKDFDSLEQEFVNDDDAMEIYSDMQQQVDEWEGVFSILELGDHMRKSKNYDIKSAARALGLDREAKIAARLEKKSKFPTTAAPSSGSTRGGAAPKRTNYGSHDDIEQWMADYTKRAR